MLEYVEKNHLAEQIEQKVEEELKERKLQKKDKTKKIQTTTSKIFSKNPYDAFNDSDWSIEQQAIRLISKRVFWSYSLISICVYKLS